MTVSSAVQEASYRISGPVVMGAAAALYLTGVLSVIAVQHFKTEAWQRSRKADRAVVGTVVFLTAFYSALTVHDIWFYGTILSDEVTVLLTGTVTATLEPLTSGIIAACVQTTLAIRSSKVVATPARRWLYIAAMGVLIALSFAGSITSTVYSVYYQRGGSNDDYLRLKFPGNLLLWMWAATVTDAVITDIILLRRRMRESNEVAASAIKMVIHISLQSALYTAALALISAIMSQSFATGGQSKQNSIPYAFWLPLAPFYALSLFTTLGAADKVTATLGQRRKLEEIRAGSEGMVSLAVLPVVMTDPGSGYGVDVRTERKGSARGGSAIGDEAKE